jgi:hypothetical protein
MLEGKKMKLAFHAQVLQQVFVEFGDSYTLLDVYKIFEK